MPQAVSEPLFPVMETQQLRRRHPRGATQTFRDWAIGKTLPRTLTRPSATRARTTFSNPYFLTNTTFYCRAQVQCPAFTSVPALMVQSCSWRPVSFTLYQPVFSLSQLSGNGRTSLHSSLGGTSQHDSRTNTADIQECVEGDRTIKRPLKTGPTAKQLSSCLLQHATAQRE